MGYGLLPGAGLASAEDIVRATATQSSEKERAARRAPLMSANQRNKLIEMYRERHGGTEAEVLQGLDAVFVGAFKHPLGEATVEEASRIIGQMIAAKVERAKK
jgi:hypothetical protein